ncbi:protein phosphatase 2C, partial [Ostertagia ostertagi]
LRHLNVSFNWLTGLPAVNGHNDRNRINTLRLSNNRLDESIVPILMKMKRLKILDLSHNKLRYFDDRLMIDMSNNALGAQTTTIATGPALNQLDLTCNSALNLTTGTLRRSHKKPVALFDIGAQPQDRVQVGFSETSGNRNKLCIRRIQYGDIFGMVDGSSNYELPKTIQNIIKRILVNTEHQNNLPAILLKAHESLEEAGERLGAKILANSDVDEIRRFELIISGCLLVHLGSSHLKLSYVGNITAAVMSSGHLEKLTESGELDEEEYDRIRSAGGTVDENNIINGVTPNCRQLGFYSLHPIITPRPINKSIPITRDTDYVIIASWAIWERLSTGQIASILTSSVNPQVAAKTIQDSLQACDYNGNSCVVVIRLLKPELAFRSAPPAPPVAFTPMAIPPMRVEKAKDQETTLQKIEQ